MADMFGRFGAWIALCLGRGPTAPLSQNDVESLTDEMGVDSYAGGTYVFRCGDAAARIHLVRSGTVALTRQVNGRDVTMQLLGPGDVFGDVPALLGECEVFDAQAVDDCSVLSLDTEALFALLQTRPQIARRWFVSLAERMAGLQSRLIDLLAGGIEAQLASILLREADERGRVRTTQGALAGLLGVQRSSVQRVLKQLEAAGLIELHYRSIDLVDRGGLASLHQPPDAKQANTRRPAT